MEKRYRALVQIGVGDGIVGVGEEVELVDSDAQVFSAAGYIEPLSKGQDDVEAAPAEKAKPKPKRKPAEKAKRKPKRKPAEKAKRKPAAQSRKVKATDDAGPLRDD